MISANRGHEIARSLFRWAGFIFILFLVMAVFKGCLASCSFQFPFKEPPARGPANTNKFTLIGGKCMSTVKTEPQSRYEIFTKKKIKFSNRAGILKDIHPSCAVISTRGEESGDIVLCGIDPVTVIHVYKVDGLKDACVAKKN